MGSIFSQLPFLVSNIKYKYLATNVVVEVSAKVEEHGVGRVGGGSVGHLLLHHRGLDHRGLDVLLRGHHGVVGLGAGRGVVELAESETRE